MAKFRGIEQEIMIDGNTYIVQVIARGTGLNTVYDCIISDKHFSVYMFGWFADQRQAKKPHVFTIDEVLEMALDNAWDYISELKRLEVFDSLLMDQIEEVDNRRSRNGT